MLNTFYMVSPLLVQLEQLALVQAEVWALVLPLLLPI